MELEGGPTARQHTFFTSHSILTKRLLSIDWLYTCTAIYFGESAKLSQPIYFHAATGRPVCLGCATVCREPGTLNEQNQGHLPPRSELPSWSCQCRSLGEADSPCVFAERMGEAPPPERLLAQVREDMKFALLEQIHRLSKLHPNLLRFIPQRVPVSEASRREALARVKQDLPSYLSLVKQYDNPLFLEKARKLLEPLNLKERATQALTANPGSYFE
jgi:hypothetical protein